jgi:hypothetical protein
VAQKVAILYIFRNKIRIFIVASRRGNCTSKDL